MVSLHVRGQLVTNEGLLWGNSGTWAGGAKGDCTEEIKWAGGKLTKTAGTISFSVLKPQPEQKALSWLLSVSSSISLPLLLQQFVCLEDVDDLFSFTYFVSSPIILGLLVSGFPDVTSNTFLCSDFLFLAAQSRGNIVSMLKLLLARGCGGLCQTSDQRIFLRNTLKHLSASDCTLTVHWTEMQSLLKCKWHDCCGCQAARHLQKTDRC